VLDVASKLKDARLARTVPHRAVRQRGNGLKARSVPSRPTRRAREHVAASRSTPVPVSRQRRGEGRPCGARALQGLAPRLAELGLERRAKTLTPECDTGALTGVPQVELVQERARYFDVHHTADDTSTRFCGEMRRWRRRCGWLFSICGDEGDLGRVDRGAQ